MEFWGVGVVSHDSRFLPFHETDKNSIDTFKTSCSHASKMREVEMLFVNNFYSKLLKWSSETLLEIRYGLSHLSALL